MTQQNKNIILLGASFDTGNLGVSALAWSSIKLILSSWPGSRVSIVGTGRQRSKHEYRRDSSSFDINLYPVRYSPRIWIQDHFLWIWLSVIIVKIMPFTGKYFKKQNSTLSEILSADVICDITGGDSFSDIYGMNRLLRGYLLKRICQVTGRPFIMLPQTYGPFKSRLAQILARRVLKKSSAIYSRDAEGLNAVEQLIGKSGKAALCPDVAFVLDPVRPANEQAEKIDNLKADGCLVVGLNISGLLYNGGYTRDNMFGLKCDYLQLVKDIILHFTNMDNCRVLLVPHVIPDNFEIENDLEACRQVFTQLSPAQQKKVIILDGKYDQNQVKHFIGLCDFFMGSRMHSTIAAISQCIPAVGLAYSKKFSGVFKTVSIENCVVDMTQHDNQNILTQLETIYQNRHDIKKRLKENIPAVKAQVNNIFKHI